MDILRQGEQVRVMGPAGLVAAVRGRLGAAVALYDDAGGNGGKPSGQ
jgi:hypothetical protein